MCNLLVQGQIFSTHDCIMERALRNREEVTNHETVIQNKEGRRIPVKLNGSVLGRRRQPGRGRRSLS